MKRKMWLLAAAALAAVTAAGGLAIMSMTRQAGAAAPEPSANTAKVEKGKLSSMVSLYGTLAYRARSDGSPYSAINQARGTYTTLPDAGDEIKCGDVLYRVDDRPVLLLCGTIPAYRDLYEGEAGNDVLELNQSLHQLGYDAIAGTDIDPGDNVFTWKTRIALEALQHDRGADVTGELDLSDAVFLPDSVRIAKLTGQPGGSAQPGAAVLDATSAIPEVQVDLDASQQGEVKKGDSAQITLPGNIPVTGKVDRLGRVAQIPAGQNSNAAAATIPAYISLDQPEKAGGLDKAPVKVQVTTDGVDGALSVPVTAITGNSGGGFAVEVLRDGGQRDLVPVELGLFDTAGGRVQVEGDLEEGDQVVVPS